MNRLKRFAERRGLDSFPTHLSQISRPMQGGGFGAGYRRKGSGPPGFEKLHG
jgi:hypothetical protein